MGNTYLHNTNRVESTPVIVFKPSFNNLVNNGELRYFMSYPQSGTPNVRFGFVGGYEWAYNTDGTQYGSVRLNGVVVADQAQTFAMLQAKYFIGPNRNINNNPIYYTLFERVEYDDYTESIYCSYVQTTHQAVKYENYQPEPYLNGTTLFNIQVDNITYRWRSRTDTPGASGYLSEFSVAGLPSTNVELRNYILNLTSLGTYILGTGAAIHAVCIKTYSTN